MATFKQILVPLDGSELAEKALPLATALVQQFQGKIFLIRVEDFLKKTGMGSHLSSATAAQLTTSQKEALQEAHDYLHKQQQALQEQGVEVEILLREISPVEAIIEAAENHEVDCIVMSTHGRGRILRLTMGSVADQIIRHAPCPVLLIRPDAEAALDDDDDDTKDENEVTQEA